MRYLSFRIQNFKGIKDATIDMRSGGLASVFCFVGLNESGKTTILEAIHSFSPDTATSELVGGDENSGVPYSARVPRHMISNFSGDVSVTAIILVTDDDKAAIERSLKLSNIIVNPASIPSEIEFQRAQIFKQGDFQSSHLALKSEIQIRSVKERKWRKAMGEESTTVRDAFYSLTPDIAYFPTFVFEFPKSIFLTNRGDVLDRFYRSTFQDILDYDNKGHTIAENVVGRIRSKELVVPWAAFLTTWFGPNHDHSQKIQHVMDCAGAAVTKVVMGRWNKIFSEDARGKEVTISYETAEGEKTSTNGAMIKTNDHDVRIKFQIKDGTRRFDVNDRSLGFRWFFAFLLFTQFRVARKDSRPLLFLFDEPASNLHAAAQHKLIESFPEIVKGEHVLAYTTHSHYMIEPKWLEQTFIVTNRLDVPLKSVLDAVSLDDESLDIQAERYRTFVNSNPGKTSYFQPILDRLEVVPSKFDFKEKSVILEGKSDYYILRYAEKLLGRTTAALIPGQGAGTLGALVAFSIGWNLPMLLILDGDNEGKSQKKRYVAEFGLPEAQATLLSELCTNVSVIEDLLDTEAKIIVSNSIGIEKEPSKSQIQRFFQERLASNNIVPLGIGFKSASETLLNAVSKKLLTL